MNILSNSKYNSPIILRCTLKTFDAFLLLWTLGRNTWFCERSSRAVLAPPYSPATLHGAGGESVPPCCRLAAAPSWFSAHTPKAQRATTQPRSASQRLPQLRKPLGAVHHVTGRLESPLAGACHVHQAAPAIGWWVGRAQSRGGDAASSAAGLWSGPCARPRETLCGAPGGESPCSGVRRGGRARLPVGDCEPACRGTRAAPWAGLPALDVRDRPVGSRAAKPESEAR